MNPFLALIITFAVALIELRLLDFFAHRGWIESHLSRKLIHILTGPLFVLCWLLFPDVWYSRWLAALVPFAITGQFALIGLGVIKDEASVKAMSRSGDRREILRGPLFYGIVFVVMTLVYWKTSPIGMLALMLMCGGDGLADILGRGLRVQNCRGAGENPQPAPWGCSSVGGPWQPSSCSYLSWRVFSPDLSATTCSPSRSSPWSGHWSNPCLSRMWTTSPLRWWRCSWDTCFSSP